MADATKNCESFYFRLLSLVQKLHSYKCTLIKAPTFQRIKKHSSLIVQTEKQFKNTETLANSCLIHCSPFISVVSGTRTINFNTP